MDDHYEQATAAPNEKRQLRERLVITEYDLEHLTDEELGRWLRKQLEDDQ